jgi:trehalose 6-phosphate phosphatase
MTTGRPLAEHAAAVAGRAAEVAICLDFDGTISPIVEDPAAARPLAGIVDLLGPLADRYAAAALVSGRPATYLASHAAAPGVRYLGMYGLEEIVDGRVQVDRRLAEAQPAVAAAARDLAADPAVRDSGAHLEDKRYAVAVHTRRVADPDRWAGPIGQAASRVAAGHGLEVVPGRMVWELRPRVHSDKGDAVRRVAAESGAGALVVVGDDLGDLPGFAVADGLGGGLRVAVRSAEAPAELLDAADLVVDGPEGVRDLLEHLLR